MLPPARPCRGNTGGVAADAFQALAGVVHQSDERVAVPRPPALRARTTLGRFDSGAAPSGRSQLRVSGRNAQEGRTTADSGHELRRHRGDQGCGRHRHRRLPRLDGAHRALVRARGRRRRVPRVHVDDRPHRGRGARLRACGARGLVPRARATDRGHGGRRRAERRARAHALRLPHGPVARPVRLRRAGLVLGR